MGPTGKFPRDIGGEATTSIDAADRAGLGRRVWTAALTGVPFGIYKLGFGWFEYDHAGHTVLGVAAMLWGAIDILANLLAVVWPRHASWCLLSNIGRWIDSVASNLIWEKVLLAVDTSLSFLIVSFMILDGRLPLEPDSLALVWNLAVVANIMAVGLEQLYRAFSSPHPRAT